MVACDISQWRDLLIVAFTANSKYESVAREQVYLSCTPNYNYRIYLIKRRGGYMRAALIRGWRLFGNHFS